MSHGMHARAKISLTFWTLACTLVALLVLGLNQQWRDGFELFVIMAGGLLILVTWRLWAVRELGRKQEIDAQRRLEELQREVSLLGRAVRIEGMGQTLLLVLGIVATGLLLVMYRGTDKLWCLAFGILVAITVLLAIAVRISKFGQPLLIVSREGVQPAGYGLLPWSAVYGIACQSLGDKHASRLVLNLYVPELKAHVASAQWFIRLFRAIPSIRQAKYRDVIMVPMHKPSELPKVIERLCRNLWQEATGRKHLWNGDLSLSQAQFTRMLIDAGTRQQAPTGSEKPEQVRAEMERLQRYAQLAEDDFLTRMAWARIWTVPGFIALALLIVQVPLGRIIDFVPTDTWAMQAFVITVVLVIIAWIVVIRRARKVFGQPFTRTRIIQLLATLSLASLLVVPMTWFLVTDIAGAVAAYHSEAPYEQLTVIATKQERNARRSCDYILRHPDLGSSLCLSRAEFLTYPEQVPVVISIRRNALGYKVYEQRVALGSR